MKQTLIVFGTRRGTTESTAIVIGETLVSKYKHHVELVNIKQIKKFKRRLVYFDYLIVGSSIVRGKWKSSVLHFLRKYDFQDKKVALFVTAGGTMNKEKEYGLSRDQVRNEAIQNYIDRYLDRFSFTPVAKTAFGGVVIRSGREKYNSWRREEIEAWAMHLGKIFA